jgi:hypothetical protein
VEEEVAAVEEVKEETPDATEVKEVVLSEEASEEQSTATDLLNQLNLNVRTSTICSISSVKKIDIYCINLLNVSIDVLYLTTG